MLCVFLTKQPIMENHLSVTLVIYAVLQLVKKSYFTRHFHSYQIVFITSPINLELLGMLM